MRRYLSSNFFRKEMLRMPLLLGIPVILWIAGAAITLVTSYWVLSAPQGAISWPNIIAWADNSIRLVIDWAFKGVKQRLALLMTALTFWCKAWNVIIDFIGALPQKISGVVAPAIQSIIDGYINPLKVVIDAISAQISGLILGKILTLESWRVNVAAWLHKSIEAPLLKAVGDILTLAKSVTQLEQWRKDVSAYIHNTIEAGLNLLKLNIEQNVKLLQNAITKASTDIMTYININVILKITAIEKWISTTADPMFNWFNNGKKWLDQLIEGLKDLLEGTEDEELISDITAMFASTAWLAAEITKAYAPVLPQIIKLTQEVGAREP
jgi:hypothetical protein